MSIRFFRVNEKFELWTTKMMKIMTMKTYSCCRLKRKKNLCVHCQRYQIQEVVKSLVRGISYKGCKQHQATSHINTYFLDLRFSPLNLNKIVGKKCQDATIILWFHKNYILFWRWRKEQQQQERRERNLHGCNNDACNLIISIFKAKLLTPISFRNFFYINAESSLHLLYPRHPISRGKCMQRILTLFYYTNVLFFLHYPNKCAKLFLPKLTVQVNN